MIELRTLGGLDLRRDDRELERVLAQPKRAALLVYLGMATPHGFHSRDILVSLFWSNSSRRRARASLRKTLHFLRRHLGSDSLVSRGGELALDRERVWCDAAAFDRAVETGSTQEAVDLYRGELLPGFHVSQAPEFERWLEEERRRLRRSAIRAAWSLSRQKELSGLVGEAARLGRHALGVDPLDELSIRRLMELLDRLGDRAGALRVYEDAAERLRNDLDLEPSPETLTLVQRLRRCEPISTEDEFAPQGPTEGQDVGDREMEGPEYGGHAVEGQKIREPRQEVAAPPSSVDPSRDSPSDPEGPESVHDPTPRTTAPVGIGVLLLGVLIASGWLLFGSGLLLMDDEDRPTAVAGPPPSDSRGELEERSSDRPTGGSRARTIAVLPFENHGSDTEERYFSDGVAEEILGALTRIPGLRVAARTSSFAFRDTDLDVRAIADSLGVETLLEGSVRRSGDRVRISATLVEPDTGFRIWSEAFEGETSDIFVMQDRVARSVARGLRVALGDLASVRLAGAVTSSPVAYNRYLRGRQLASQRTRESVLGAIGEFEAAVEADPTYASAFAGLANAYTLARVYSFVPLDSGYVWAGREIAFADRAVALDPLDGEAHASLGWMTWNLGGPLDAAERHLRRGLELQPSLAPAVGWHGMLLSLRGRHSEALEAQARALQLDPVSPGVRVGYAASALWAGRPDETLLQIRRAREIQPGLGGLATAYEVWALLLMDRTAECLQLDLTLLPAYEATCLHQAGRYEEANAAIARAAAAWNRSSSALETNGLVIHHAWTGRRREALAWVRRGFDTSPYVPASSPVFTAPGGLWDPALEPQGNPEGPEDVRRSGDAVRATLRELREDVWSRVLDESRRVNPLRAEEGGGAE